MELSGSSDAVELWGQCCPQWTCSRRTGTLQTGTVIPQQLQLSATELKDSTL